MEKVSYKAAIHYDTTDGHPDTKTAARGLVFSDTYHFNPLVFDTSGDSCREYIEEDLQLVAGGGYDARHIENVSFTISRI